MDYTNPLRRIARSLLALQQAADGSTADRTQIDLELWQQRLERFARVLEEVAEPSAPTTTRRIESELRAVIRTYAGYPAAFVAHAELVPEETVRRVRVALRQTAEHGVPQGKPKTARVLS